MKFPEQRLSMEAALPPSIQNWFGHELEIRGIDSLIYCRHVIQLLQQEDLDDSEFPDYVDLIFSTRLEGKGKLKPKKFEKKKSLKNQEERKKTAAIKCLQAVSDEANGIETLVEELCARLKQLNEINYEDKKLVTQIEDSSSSTQSDASGSDLDDPAERYYAAFPALHGKDNQLSSPFGTESLDVWKNNPITKLITRNKTGHADSENESKTHKHFELKRSTFHKSQKKSYKKTNDDSVVESNIHYRSQSKTSKKGLKINQQAKENDNSKICRFRSWPEGAVDGNNQGNKDKELCHQVENLLKEMLLNKTEPSKKCSPAVETVPGNEGSVSPELQENDSWYTQPIEVLFSTEEPRQRLYKRNSYPLFTSLTSSPAYDDFEEEQEILLEDNLTNLEESIVATEDEDEVFDQPNQAIKLLSTDTLTYDGFSKDLQENFTSPIPIPQVQSHSTSKSSIHYDLTNTSLTDRFDCFTTPYDNLIDYHTVSSSSESEASVIETASLQNQQVQDTNGVLALENSLLDRNYLVNFQCETLEGPYLYPDTLSLFGFSESEESTWPSKVLFDDFVLPYDWIWKDIEIGYSTEFYEKLKSGNLSHVWDVNYQKIKGTICPFKNDIWKPLECPEIEWFIPGESMDQVYSSAYIPSDQQLKFTLISKRFEGTENTLIPQITFDLASEAGSEYDNINFNMENDVLGLDMKDDTVEQQIRYGDFNGLWSMSEQTINTRALMSRSFDLIPSERSAFVGAIPRKIHHVQSEPNLKYCSQHQNEFTSPAQEKKSKSESKTPDEEHLYFSPKTHFRPIQTPVNQDTMSDFHLRDLFGGYSASQTPYQRYFDNKKETEEFVPMFKIREDMDKYIQTGSSFEESNYFKDGQGQSSEKIIHYDERSEPIVEEFDIFGYIDSLTASVANTPQNLQDNQYTNCDSGYEDTDVETSTEKVDDRNQGRAPAELIARKSNHIYTWQNQVQLNEDSDNPDKLSCNCPSNYEDAESGLLGCRDSYGDVFFCESEPPVHHWMISEAWGLDPGSINTDTTNRSIWSNPKEDMAFSDTLNYAEHEGEKTCISGNKGKLEDADFKLDYGQSYSELTSYFPKSFDASGTNQNRFFAGNDENSIPVIDKENLPPQQDNDDIVKVKLVIRRGRTKRDVEEESQQSQLFMPMPIAALYSCELEQAWMSGKRFSPDFLQSPFTEHTAKGSKRKPCSFFMEGACRRSDCKYAHDLSGITCRFWQNGDCFKGDLCPFLHGFPSAENSPSLTNTGEFAFQLDDFPNLDEHVCDMKKVKTSRTSKQKNVKMPLKSSRLQHNRSCQKFNKDDRTKSTEKRTGLKRKNSSCGIEHDSAVL